MTIHLNQPRGPSYINLPSACWCRLFTQTEFSEILYLTNKNTFCWRHNCVFALLPITFTECRSFYKRNIKLKRELNFFYIIIFNTTLVLLLKKLVFLKCVLISTKNIPSQSQVLPVHYCGILNGYTLIF